MLLDRLDTPHPSSLILRYTACLGSPMLTIRLPQMFSLGSDEIEQYTNKVVAHLAEHYPEDYAECHDEGFRRLVEMAIQMGVEHGIRGEGGILTLAELLLEFGETFERSPDQAWARSILEHPKMPGALKIRLLSERLRARTGGRRIVKIVVGSS